MSNKSNSTLYTGVTNGLIRRTIEHKHKLNKNGFTSKYKIGKLLYYEVFDDIYVAIAREKQIKAGSRQKKVDLINKFNPGWRDLFDVIDES